MLEYLINTIAGLHLAWKDKLTCTHEFTQPIMEISSRDPKMDNEFHHHMFKIIMCKLVAATIPGHLSVLLWTMGSEMRMGSKLLLIMKIEKMIR